MRQKISTSMSSVREHNQLAILETIFTKGETSRALLAKELRVSKPAISDNLEPLLNLGIVEEAGEGEAAEAEAESDAQDAESAQ